MRRFAFLTSLLLIVAAGPGCAMNKSCAERGKGCATRHERPVRPPQPNLLLAAGPQTVRLGADLNERSDWPAVAIGYRVDDISYSDVLTLDDQSFFDGDGAYIRSAQSVRSSILVR